MLEYLIHKYLSVINEIGIPTQVTYQAIYLIKK